MISTLAAAPSLSLTERATALLTGRDSDAPSLLSALGAVVDDQHALADWLRTFDDADQAARVADRSYWHPNGFAKLVLHVAPDFRVRLHVWPAGTDRLGETNPHGHRWDFASTLLCGDGLSTTNYLESETGLPYVRHCYVGGAGVGSLTPVGNARLVASDSRIVRTHERYSVTTSVMHTVEPLGTSLVATLVVQGAPRVGSATVYCVPGLQADQPGRGIAPGEVRDLVHGVLAAPDGPAGEEQ